MSAAPTTAAIRRLRSAHLGDPFQTSHLIGSRHWDRFDNLPEDRLLLRATHSARSLARRGVAELPSIPLRERARRGKAEQCRNVCYCASLAFQVAGRKLAPDGINDARKGLSFA